MSRPSPCPQVSAHIPHEANSEQTFSLSGNLSDPNMKPLFLAKLTRTGINKNIFKPSHEAICNRYFAKFSKGGKVPEQEDEEALSEAPAPAPAPAPA